MAVVEVRAGGSPVGVAGHACLRLPLVGVGARHLERRVADAVVARVRLHPVVVDRVHPLGGLEPDVHHVALGDPDQRGGEPAARASRPRSSRSRAPGRPGSAVAGCRTCAGRSWPVSRGTPSPGCPRGAGRPRTPPGSGTSRAPRADGDPALPGSSPATRPPGYRPPAAVCDGSAWQCIGYSQSSSRASQTRSRTSGGRRTGSTTSLRSSGSSSTTSSHCWRSTCPSGSTRPRERGKSTPLRRSVHTWFPWKCIWWITAPRLTIRISWPGAERAACCRRRV